MNRNQKDSVVCRVECLGGETKAYALNPKTWGVNARVGWLGVIFRTDNTIGLTYANTPNVPELLACDVSPGTAWAAMRRAAKGGHLYEVVRDLKLA